MSAFETGPYLAAAFLCEKVLTEGDGVNSYIRVVDKLVRQVVSAEKPTGLGPHRVQLTLVVILKPGEAKGSFPLWFEIERPSGQRGPNQALTVNFSAGPQSAVNVHAAIDLEFDQQGVWWIDVIGGDQRTLMSRIPAEFLDLWIMGPPQPGPGSPA